MEWALLALGLAIGGAAGFAIRRFLAASHVQSAESRAETGRDAVGGRRHIARAVEVGAEGHQAVDTLEQ